MATDETAKPAYKLAHEGGARILKINYEDSIYAPSIEDDPDTMALVIDILLETGHVNKISFLQREEYEYDTVQANLLLEIKDVYGKLVREENVLDFSGLFGTECEKFVAGWHAFLREVILDRLKKDPIGAYVLIRRQLREELIKQKTEPMQGYAQCSNTYVILLRHIAELLERCRLIQLSAPDLDGYKIDNRDIYKKLFRPQMRPVFMYTKLATAYPAGAEEIDSYKLPDGTSVLILKTQHDIRPLYHINPEEFLLSEDKYGLLIEARQVLAEHQPQKSEYTNIGRTRQTFLNIEKDLLHDLAKSRGMQLNYQEIERLAEILLRYTIGFGLIEVLLSDPNIQDIVVNAPMGINPISLIHATYGECRTNIIPTFKEGQSWATKLRLISGRPLDEANPVLDTELLVPGGRARVAAIQQPLSPTGLAYAFRRHRDKPWTLPLFIKNGMMTPLAAGLFSFLIDGARTILIAGTRSSGKTSLLGALLVEIMRSSRILTVEDTLELPVDQLRKLGYDIQSMKVRSVITPTESEVPAEQGIRTALRLGDSALIVGEVRSKEALALYEAMRVGALAKVVAGTIHGDSPYSVFDRVVNDLGVPKTSFKATDIIAVANPITSPSGLQQVKRLVEGAEVRKHWTDDPLREKGFADLMAYAAKTDKIEPTEILTEGESEIIKAIGSRVKEWAGNWDAIWQNIELRANIKQAIIDAASKTGDANLLEAPFVVRANDEFHIISQAIAEEVGVTDSGRVYSAWSDWLKQYIKKKA